MMMDGNSCCGEDLDECGVCFGDGSSCGEDPYAEITLQFDADVSQVNYSSNTDIYGFQFNLSGDMEITGADGGAAADAGFAVETANNTVLGFSFAGSFIPAGSGVLTVLSWEGATCGEACISDVIISGENGVPVENSGNTCINYELGDCYDPSECLLDCPGFEECFDTGGSCETDQGACEYLSIIEGDACLDNCDEGFIAGVEEWCASRDCAGTPNGPEVEDCAGVCAQSRDAHHSSTPAINPSSQLSKQASPSIIDKYSQAP
jgi:hypothetical protein